MLHYILQTVAFQVFFLIIYDLFLKKETFFNWNRAYLIGTAFLSFTLPFLKFESIKAIVPEPMVVRLPEVIIGEVSPTLMDEALMIQPQQISEQAMSFSWDHIWMLGMVLAALILAYKLVKISALLRKNPKRWKGNILMVYLLNSHSAFSFFNTIFLGTSIETEKQAHIVQHEMVHIQEKHSLDLLGFEILRIVFWFNPLIYMYQNRLAILHEFIADAQAVKYKGKSDYYQSLLSQVFETQHISFINPFFNQSSIKKRIVMLSKSKSKQIHLIKYALLIPMVMAMLMYTSSYASEIKDPFPFLQQETVTQELTFQELVDKYYNEIVELSKSKNQLAELYSDFVYGDNSYIESIENVAKRQALMNFFLVKIRSEKEIDEVLTEADKEKHEKMINKYKTYEDYLAYKKTDLAKKSWESMAPFGEWRLVVDDMGNFTDAEQKRKDELLALIEKDEFYSKLHMTDGKSTIIRDLSKNESRIIKQDNTTSNVQSDELYDIEVPYAVIEEVPIFQGCEDLESNTETKQCTSDKISMFVNKNFNVDLATQLGLTGKQRISVIFKIGKDGKIRDVMARAPHPALEAEAVRVIELLPDFTPGKQRGKAVTVPYSLPILFQVQDNQNINESLKAEKSGEPFVALDEVLILSNGQATTPNQTDQQSDSFKISQFISENFNAEIAKEHNLTGNQRISIIFKIGSDGKVKNVQARASNLALETEGIRVINSMPDFIFGRPKVKAATVSYSLPIIIQTQGPTAEINRTKNDQEKEIIEVPFAVVDEVPFFPSCETLASNEERKQCTSDEISSFVNKNFNIKLAKELGLEGMQRIMVIFKIQKDGSISDIKSRASHPELEKEAIRVINALPKMHPGKQIGKPVVVPYSLPILFQVQK